MMRSYDDADILRHADHSVLIHEAPRQNNANKSGTLPRPKVMYIFDSDLIWRIQLNIIKGKNSCCVCREFLMLNA